MGTGAAACARRTRAASSGRKLTHDVDGMPGMTDFVADRATPVDSAGCVRQCVVRMRSELAALPTVFEHDEREDEMEL